MKPVDEQKSILDKEILKLIDQGWVVKSRTDFTCELTKKVSGCATLLVIFPFFMRDFEILSLNIEVTENGVIKNNS